MLPKNAVGFVLLAASLIGQCRAALEDGCDLQALGACGDDYIPFGNTDHLAAPGKQLQDKFAKEKQQVSCALRFADECLAGAARTAVLVSMASLREAVNAACTEGSETDKNFQKAGPCLNSTGAEIHACFQDMKASLQRAVVNAPAKEVVPHSCCAYNDVIDCISEVLKPCEGVGAKDHLLGLLDRVMGKAMRLVCIDYTRGSPACKTLPKLPPLSPEDRKVDHYIELLIEVAYRI